MDCFVLRSVWRVLILFAYALALHHFCGSFQYFCYCHSSLRSALCCHHTFILAIGFWMRWICQYKWFTQNKTTYGLDINQFDSSIIENTFSTFRIRFYPTINFTFHTGTVMLVYLVCVCIVSLFFFTDRYRRNVKFSLNKIQIADNIILHIGFSAVFHLFLCFLFAVSCYPCFLSSHFASATFVLFLQRRNVIGIDFDIVAHLFI